MRLCLCPKSLHPTLSPRTPGCPSAAPDQGWGAGGGGGRGRGVPNVPQFLCGSSGWPCCVPALPPSSVASLQDTEHGDICTRTRTERGSLGGPLGATTNRAAPLSADAGTPRGHISPCWPWGNRGRGSTGGECGSPEGPEQAQPWLLPALFIAGPAMCGTCAAARAGAGVSPGCACSGPCPGALATLTALGDPVPAPPHTAGLSGDPAPWHRALGLSRYQHHPARGLHGGPQPPTDHSGHVLPCASPRE